MLTDALREPLQLVRLSLAIKNITEISQRVTEAGGISQDDIASLARWVETLQDFKPYERHDSD